MGCRNMYIKLLTFIFLTSFINLDVRAQTDEVPTSTDVNKDESHVEQADDPAPRKQKASYLKISAGSGPFFHYADVKERVESDPHSLRLGYNLKIGYSISESFDIKLMYHLGKLAGNEVSSEPHRNFESNFIGTGATIVYHLDNNVILQKYAGVSAYLFAGLEHFTFDTKTDLLDANGTKYYYWTNGGIFDRAEDHPNARRAIAVQRDYTYETTVIPSESFIAFPIGLGFKFKLSEKIGIDLSATYFLSQSDKIDNVEQGSNDNLLYTSVAMSYDLNFGKKDKVLKNQCKLACSNLIQQIQTEMV